MVWLFTFVPLERGDLEIGRFGAPPPGGSASSREPRRSERLEAHGASRGNGIKTTSVPEGRKKPVPQSLSPLPGLVPLAVEVPRLVPWAKDLSPLPGLVAATSLVPRLTPWVSPVRRGTIGVFSGEFETPCRKKRGEAFSKLPFPC